MEYNGKPGNQGYDRLLTCQNKACSSPTRLNEIYVIKSFVKDATKCIYESVRRPLFV